MAVKTETRCMCCGTKIRNNRAVCPSCGLDLKAPLPEQPEQNSHDSNAASGGPGIKKAAAKPGMKICPICLASVPEEQITEQDGQKICPACIENMKNKAAKKAVQPPPQKK